MPAQSNALGLAPKNISSPDGAKEGGELPRGWEWKTIPDLIGDDGVFIDGDWVESKDQDPDGDVRLIQLADVGDGSFRDKSDRSMTKAKAEELRCTFLKDGDVLIARMPDPLGRACIFPGDPKPAVTVVDVAIVRSGDGEFDHRWLANFVNAHPFRAAVSGLQAGSTRKRISRGNLATIPLPVPPLPEQRRIVAEIEKQFTRLDAGVSALRRMQANLERYRAAVLKAACEGTLVPTEAELQKSTRKNQRGFESGEELLQRILDERRKNWTGRGKYKEPTAPDTANLPSLPAGWTWASVGQLGEIKGGKRLPMGHTYSPTPTSFPYIRVVDFENYGVRQDDLKYLREETQREIQRYTISKDDVYISIAGSIGVVGVVPDNLDGANLTENAAKITSLSFVERRYICFWLSSNAGQAFVADKTIATTQPKLALFRIEVIPIPLPPLAEQTRIVAEVERRLSVIEEIEAVVSANLQRATRLRQSILQKAFSGELIDARQSSAVV